MIKFKYLVRNNLFHIFNLEKNDFSLLVFHSMFDIPIVIQLNLNSCFAEVIFGAKQCFQQFFFHFSKFERGDLLQSCVCIVMGIHKSNQRSSSYQIFSMKCPSRLG